MARRCTGRRGRGQAGASCVTSALLGVGGARGAQLVGAPYLKSTRDSPFPPRGPLLFPSRPLLFPSRPLATPTGAPCYPRGARSQQTRLLMH